MQFIFKIGSKIKEVWPVYKVHFGVFLLLMVLTTGVQLMGSNRNWVLVVISYIASIEYLALNQYFTLRHLR